MSETGIPKGWPDVHPQDDGIRPAGLPDECFYCGQKVGRPHIFDCVVVTKKVKIRYSIEVEEEVPHYWSDERVKDHREESSWCGNNLISVLELLAKEKGCLCGEITADVVAVIDGNPSRKVVTRG